MRPLHQSMQYGVDQAARPPNFLQHHGWGLKVGIVSPIVTQWTNVINKYSSETLSIARYISPNFRTNETFMAQQCRN